MSFTRPAALAALALAAAVSAASSFAGDGGGHQIPQACQSDAASLCPGMAPGDGKFGKCMKAHRDKVSEGCKAAAKSARGGGHAGKHAGAKGASGATPGMSETPDDE